MTSERPPEKVMQTVRSGRRIFWWVGVLVFGASICMFVWYALAVTLGEDVDGVVIAIGYDRASGKNAPARWLEAEFLDGNTKRITHRKLYPLPWRTVLVGDRLSMKYWRFTGSLNINTFWDIWSRPMLVCFVGAVAFGVSRVLAAVDQQPPA